MVHHAFPKHFDGGHFYNPDAAQARGWLDVLRWKLTSRPERSPRFISDVQQSVPPSQFGATGLGITFVNHSTVLVQQRCGNVLTDPIWSERASPFCCLGPRRRRLPGVRLEDLPPIALVLISHDHFDHLDFRTLHLLISRHPTTIVVPARLGRLLRSREVAPVYELDWGESLAMPNFRVHCVPALHFSARGVFDRNKTLWCGYMIECQDRFVYFAGDTGFGVHFEEIREKFGCPYLALLPIGAYEPRWCMSAVHMAPEEAVRAHRILGAKTSIAIHHGTFQLADDGPDTASRELLHCRGQESFLVLNNGQFLEIP